MRGVVGRDAMLARLREVVDPASRMAAAVMRGEAGIGKTTVLNAVVETALDGGLRVRCEAASRLQQDVPFALVADLFVLRPQAADPSRAALGRLVVGEDAGAGPATDPYARVLAVTEGLADLLMAEAQETPTVLVIDDLHWGDRPSLLVVDRLLRRAPQLGLRMVAATRPTDRSEVQAIIQRAADVGVGVVELPPLGEDDAAAVLSEMLGGRPGPHLRGLAAGAAGNPLYLSELGRAAAAMGELQRQGDVVDLSDPAAPSSLRITVLARLAGLPDATTRALQVASILGASIDVAVLAAMVDADPLQVLADLRPAMVAGLVIDSGGALTFRHDLVRGALSDDLPVSARRALHRRAAARMRSTSAAAAHLEAAGPPYTDADLDVLVTAAEQTVHIDGRRAASLCELVLAHIDADDGRRVPLRARRAQALVAAGELDQAHEALRALERDGLHTGLDVGLALLEAQGARDQPDPDLVARLRTQAVQLRDTQQRLKALGLIAYHAARANVPALGALLDDLPVDDPRLPVEARVHLLLARAQQHWVESDAIAALDLARQAVRITRDEAVNPPVRMRAGLVLGRIGSDFAESRAEAIAALEEVTAGAEEARHPAMAVRAHATLANAYWAEGDWDEAEAAYGAAASAAADADMPRWQALGLGNLAQLVADRGDIERAQALFHLWSALGWRTECRPASIQARIAWGAGRDADAIAAWTTDVKDPQTSPFFRAISAMFLAVAGMTVGDHTALAAAAEAVADAEAMGDPAALMRSAIMAVVEDDLPAAVAAAEQSRAVPVHGFAQLAEIVGLMARDADDTDTAARWLREAHDVWERCGAVALRGRTAVWLREVGVHSRGRIVERPTTGWASLTDAERHVVDEVTKGLVYREVGERLHISRRTVETHMANALRKLGLSNRSHLAAEYARRPGGR